MAKAKKAKKAKAATEEVAKRGRKGQFDGAKIHKITKDWPGREGTLIANSFALMRNGMTYESYIEAGGRYIDLVDAIKQGHVSAS